MTNFTGRQKKMKLKDFLKTWEGTLAENKFNRLFVLLLMVANLVLGAKIFFTQPVITMQPPTLDTQAWVAEDKASQSYKEAWGMYLATQIGNVTPSTVVLIKDWLGPLLSPAVYDEVISALEVQVVQIKNDRVSMRFEPRTVVYEPDSEKVFVYGYSYTIGVHGHEERTERTYEFRIGITQFLPTVDFIDTYADKPRTKKVLRVIERREEARKEREDD